MVGIRCCRGSPSARGLLVDRGKMYVLISGYNTMPKSKKAKVDVENVARSLGVWAYVNAAMAGLVGVLLALGIEVWIWVPMVFFGLTTAYLLVHVQRYDGNVFKADGSLRPGAWKGLTGVGAVVVALVIGTVALAVALA